MTAMVDSSLFRAAMARMGAAVNIITTDGPAGLHGMTATAVCSVSDEPASLLVCINRYSRMNAIINRNSVLCVSVLSGEHEELSGIFASWGVTMDERFASAQWRAMANGAPALADALACFACSIDAVYEAGTHSVFLCRVDEVAASDEGEGLVYFGRSYHRLPPPSAA